MRTLLSRTLPVALLAVVVALPLAACGGQDSPAAPPAPRIETSESITEEAARRDMSRLPTVDKDLKTLGSGWIREEIIQQTRDVYTGDAMFELTYIPVLHVLIPASRTHCLIDPSAKVARNRKELDTYPYNAFDEPWKEHRDVRVSWDGMHYVIEGSQEPNAPQLEIWKQLGIPIYESPEWLPATCPAP